MNTDLPEKEFVFDLRIIERIIRVFAVVIVLATVGAMVWMSVGQFLLPLRNYSETHRIYESQSPLFDEVQNIMASSTKGADIFGSDLKINYDADSSKSQFETNKSEGTLIFDVQGSKNSGKIKAHWVGHPEAMSVMERQILPPEEKGVSFSFSKEKDGLLYALKNGSKWGKILIANRAKQENAQNALCVDKIELSEKGDGAGIIFEK